MTKEQLHVLQHTLGCDEYGRRAKYASDRNYYVGGSEECHPLVTMGYMTEHKGSEITGGDPLFTVTDAGKKAMRDESPSPPKLTRSQMRYREYLEADGCLGETFREFLSNIQTQWYKDAKAGVHSSSMEDYV
jgi:hypothetical protein